MKSIEGNFNNSEVLELLNKHFIEQLIKNLNLYKKEKLNLSFFKNSNKQKIDIHFDSYVYENAVNIYKSF